MPDSRRIDPTPKARPAPRDVASDHGHGSDGARTQPLNQSFGWRVFEISAIALSVLVIGSVLWFAIDVLLLLFGAVLLATTLRAPVELLNRSSGMSDGLALLLVLVVLVALFAALGALLAPEVVGQVPQLIDSLGRSVRALVRGVGIDEWAEGIMEDFNPADVLPSPAGLVGGATGIIASTFGAIANLVILVVIGLYLAATPSVYVEGATRLVPQQKRERMRDTLEAVGITLRWWFIGQLVTMSAVGVLTYAALQLLGVPLAMVLAVIAFLLTFIPFIGPIVAAVPILLVAFSQGLEVGLWALALYVVIQSFEGYVLTPLVQRRSVKLPPALTIAAQIVLGVLVGAIGIALATPLAAAGLVAVKMLYVENVLGEETDADEVLKDEGEPDAPEADAG